MTSILIAFLFFSTPFYSYGVPPFNEIEEYDSIESDLKTAHDNDFLRVMQVLQPSRNSNTYNMYRSDEKKFIWFRVFKVASSTTRVFLKKHVADLIQTRPTHVPRKYKDYFKFAFVRNPWDRVVSCYFHKVVNKEVQQFQECFDKDFDFFVDYISKTDLRTANAHIRLQTELVPPVQTLDFIGKLDTFTADFQHVCDVIGIEYHPLTHEHQTDHLHYSAYYTPRTRRIIARKYRADIQAFGFKFEAK